MTVAQYLWSNDAYDGVRQQPIDLDHGTHEAHETIVIEESSMLTEDMLASVLSTFTGSVRRLILVGDPAQLPPIGPGRPFADLVAHLDPITDFDDEDSDEVAARRGTLGHLRHEVRNFQGAASDTLRLAAARARPAATGPERSRRRGCPPSSWGTRS
jgi:ATP-dependent exoDNAse (exonuclease V) alpha subunit